MGGNNLEKYRLEVVGKASGIVLEIGFGSGLNLPFYKNISKLYALDPSLELFHLAKERIKVFPFPFEHTQSSAEKIPFEDNTFDSVLSTWSLCSIPEPAVALKEIFRVLKPDGKFIFIEHGISPREIPAKLQKLLTSASKRFTGGCHMDREIDKLICDAGFEIQKLEKFQEKFEPLNFMYKGIAIAKKQT